MVVALVAVSAVIDVVANVEFPSAVKVPFEVSDEVAVIEPPVKVFIVPVTAERKFAKKLVEVPCVMVALPIVVVPRLVLPKTTKLPVEVEFPFRSTVNLLFSVQPLPFQYKILFVAKPPVSDPDTVVQNVDVPVEARTCPSNPVLLPPSEMGPVRLSLEIVVVASVEAPATIRVDAEKIPPFALILKIFAPVLSCAWKRFATCPSNPLTEIAVVLVDVACTDTTVETNGVVVPNDDGNS